MKLNGRFISIAAGLIACVFVTGPIVNSRAQEKQNQEKQVKDDGILKAAPAPPDVCTGFISEDPLKSNLRIVGGVRERQNMSFTEHDLVFLNKGLEQGMTENTVYSIVRPMGEFIHPFTKRKLGYFVREVGTLKITQAQGGTSTAVITRSCDTIWMSDVLIPVQPAAAVQADKQGEQGAKLKGQIVLSNEFHEYLSTNDIVFVDIGSKQGVQPGDSFTIYRPVGMSEGVTKYRDDKVYQKKSGGFGSDRYHGGDFSIDAPNQSADVVIQQRPQMPYKVVGKLVLLRVDGTASVGKITFSREEVNIGDYVLRTN